MFENKYRIVSDGYSGFEAQVKFWWFPFIWCQLSYDGVTIGINTNRTINQAKVLINNHHQHNKMKGRKVWQGSGNDALQQIDYNKE